MKSERLSDGWVRHEQAAIRRDYWLDPFPAGPAKVTMGIEMPSSTSPIDAYDSDLASVEWVNAIADCAFLMALHRRPSAGAGQVHVWYSSGGGALPREITASVIGIGRLVFDDEMRWLGTWNSLKERVEAYAGMLPASATTAIS
ncbi:hypothetical protein [Rhodococcus sp. IEGM 1343]|jgi:hypothetical protein|uniref:hypothetical protein n=1 Tax=Rhodococcus sp. IEGM 1343 TaxID=3082224 RepID=UPI0029558E7C|nr:hypothetical protein [Rhodococcus sp. IEGM 1343]MDV8056449.1 hypothetical protein [Rhodococcus sp. IEGM 1343]